MLVQRHCSHIPRTDRGNVVTALKGAWGEGLREPRAAGAEILSADRDRVANIQRVGGVVAGGE
jgi:hypothetical protein